MAVAESAGDREVRAGPGFTPDDVAIELRGGGNASRQVGSLMLPDFPADRLHVVEVWTPGGNWSSFPPHKHEHDREGESELEETYYYRLRDPENGGRCSGSTLPSGMTSTSSRRCATAIC